VKKIAKVALGNKTNFFGISCKLLTKNSIYNMFVLFPCAREITEPKRKMKIRINDLWEIVLY
jgi:hypothetical protein